jgi:hypothetical protein
MKSLVCTAGARKRVLRSHFGSSRLVRTLDAWTPVDAEASGMDFAERLSLWVNAFDAIGLQSAQQSIRAIRTPAPGQPRDARPAAAAALAEDVQRARAALAKAIARELDAPPEGYAPWRQRHLDLQRQVEMMLGPLRDHVRQALSRASTRLRQLAALDALMVQMVGPREQALLPTATHLMERRFEQLRLEQADGWLEAFAADWRGALLAELDLRLEPVNGMVEAMAQELKKLE